MTYSLDKNCKKEDELFIFKINENVISNENVSDRIGICYKNNILWFANDCDLYD